MRVIDKLISFVFHVFVIVLAVSVLLVLIGFVDFSVINGLLTNYLFNESYKLIVMSSTILVILAGLKITVFSSALSNTAAKSILVDTAHGKIQINQETIENVAKNVISEFDSVKDVSARMTKAKNGINMYLMISVYQNTNIKEVITKIQENVKSQVENMTSVIVRNVDVKIKNVSGSVSEKKNKSSNVSKDNVESSKTQSVADIPSAQIVEPVNNIENVIVEEKVVAPKVETTENTQTTENQTVDGYMKDENNILYKIEPNPNSDK